MINAPDFQPENLEYPVEFHFRIICDCGVDVVDSINKIACQYSVTQNLNSSNFSSSRKYHSYSISVIFGSRPEMLIFDRDIKALPGVRMLL